MTKVNLKLTLEPIFYNWAKMNIPNISAEFQNYVKSRMRFQEIDPNEEELLDIKERIGNHQKLIEQESSQMAFLLSQAEAIENKLETDRKKLFNEAILKGKSLENAGFVRDMYND
jgi:hypothetical protein